ncbi:MAG: AbrB/MazE/SpoVT family DNA-binding domain-containing protein [Actinobacteria bacterium]|nr:MAG: AbrB/MazE/SpoVT family DNA-binding domain-containing protein [Actinomycetota bacterium]
MKAVVSEKGQVTIPKPIRKRLGIGPGVVLDFEASEGKLVASKTVERSPLDEVYGSLDLGEPVNDYIERIRGR